MMNLEAALLAGLGRASSVVLDRCWGSSSSSTNFLVSVDSHNLVFVGELKVAFEVWVQFEVMSRELTIFSLDLECHSSRLVTSIAQNTSFAVVSSKVLFDKGVNLTVERILVDCLEFRLVDLFIGCSQGDILRVFFDTLGHGDLNGLSHLKTCQSGED